MRKSPKAREPKRWTSQTLKWSGRATSMAGTTAAAGQQGEREQGEQRGGHEHAQAAAE